MWEDPIVEEVRKARKEYAVRFHRDLEAIFRDLKQREEASQREKRVLSPKPVQRIRQLP